MFPDAMINFHYCFLSYLVFLVPHSPYLSLFYQDKFHFFCKDRGKIRTTYNGEFLFEPHSFLLSFVPPLSACSKLCSDITFIELFEKMK